MGRMEITTQIGCKNACSYCPQDKLIAAYPRDNASRRMSFDVFKQCLDKIPAGVDIQFSGMSEPWLNPECTEMLLYAHEQGHKIRVFTTLEGMRLVDIDKFESIPFRGFRVHLPTEASRMNICIDDNYLGLIKRLASSRIANLIFNAHGEDVLPAVNSMLAKEKKRIVQMPLSARGGSVQASHIAVSHRQGKVMGCIRGLKQNVLLPNGDVVLCCMDWGMQHVLGNLLMCEYVDLFTGKEFLKVKQGLQCASADILCKYCDVFTYEAALKNKMWAIVSSNIKRLPMLYRMWWG